MANESGRSNLKVILAAIAAVVVIGVAAVLFLVPFKRTAVGAFQLSPAVVTTVTTPRAGIFTTIEAKENAYIEKGAPLATWNTDSVAARVKALEAQLATARSNLGKLQTKAQRRAQASLAKAKAKSDKANVALERARAAAKGKKKSSALTRATRAAASAESAYLKLVKTAGVGQKAQLEQSITELTKAISEAKGELESNAFPAPTSGVVSRVRIAPGAQFAADAEFLSIEVVDPLNVAVKSPKGISTNAELVVGGKKYKVTLDSSGKGTLDNRDRKIDSHASGEVILTLPPKPLLR